MHVTPERFLVEGKDIEFKDSSYYISYPEFIRYFNDIAIIEKHNLIIGINFTYGWMPTIFDFLSVEFEKPVKILNNVKRGIIPDINELAVLKKMFNNSLVGTSKILHFINPTKFAIWDSRVYRYLTGMEPYVERIGDYIAYLEYLKFCEYLSNQEGYAEIHRSIEQKIGYEMTKYRTVELIMYTKGEKPKPPKNENKFLKDNTDFGKMQHGVVQ